MPNSPQSMVVCIHFSQKLIYIRIELAGYEVRHKLRGCVEDVAIVVVEILCFCDVCNKRSFLSFFLCLSFDHLARYCTYLLTSAIGNVVRGFACMSSLSGVKELFKLDSRMFTNLNR
jgi:hypothetical protein